MVLLQKTVFFLLLLTTSISHALPTYKPSHLFDIQQRGYLRVALLKQAMDPFVIYHGDQSITGIDIELAQKAADLLGVKVIFLQTAKNYDELLQQVYDKKADMAISGIIRTPTRAKSVQLSHPYYTYPIGLLLNRIKYDQLDGDIFTAFNAPTIKIGVLTGGAFIGYVSYLYPKANMVFYESSMQMLQDVATDKIDAAMMDELVVKVWLAHKPERALRTRYLVLPNYHAGYSIASSYDNRIFNIWINEFIDEARAIGATDRLLKKYTQGDIDVAAQ